MEVQVRHNRSFAVARVVRSGGEDVKVEAGAITAHSAGVALDAETEGGLRESSKRATLGGRSLFVSSHLAPPEGGWVEGRVFEFTGPVRVMTQSRNLRSLLDRSSANLPGQRAHRSRGGGPWPTRTS